MEGEFGWKEHEPSAHHSADLSLKIFSVVVVVVVVVEWMKKSLGSRKGTE